MEFNLGDEIEYNDKKYILMSTDSLGDKKYFLLSTTEKPITGILVEYKIINDELFINE